MAAILNAPSVVSQTFLATSNLSQPKHFILVSTASSGFLLSPYWTFSCGKRVIRVKRALARQETLTSHPTNFGLLQETYSSKITCW